MAGSKSTASEREQTMADPIDRLVQDHRKLMNLLRKLREEEAGPRLSPEEILDELDEELEMHARLEEALFHPALGDGNAAERRALVEHQREHDAVAAAVDELRRTDSSTDEFAARARELADFISEHAEQEESSIFPQIRVLLGEAQLESIGRRLPPTGEND